MKRNINKKWLGMFAFCGALCALAACSDDLTVNYINDEKYEVSESPIAFLNNPEGANRYIVDLYNAENETVELTVNLSKPVSETTEWKLVVDESLSGTYNQAHETDFTAFPSSLVEFTAGNQISVQGGKVSSDPVKVSIKAGSDLVVDKTYVLPIRVESTANGVAVSAEKEVYYYLIKPQGNRLNPQKDPDVKVMSCFGVNEENPLIHKELFLKKSGKPLFDIVILFSANFNYNTSTQQVFVNCNSNVSHILNNREKYLKPLKDMGIKVVLGMLGNRDFTGCGTLTRSTCKALAKEFKNYCDQYDLDGVFFDDEYSSGTTDRPGFDNNGMNASYLCYESKQAMPDKLVIPFLWASMRSFYEVDGKKPGEYCDYFIPNYFSAPNPYSGATFKQMGARSQEMTGYQWCTGRHGDLGVINEKGYGATMVFGMGPYQEVRKAGAWRSWADQLKSLDAIAYDVFSDEVYWTGVKPEKDW